MTFAPSPPPLPLASRTLFWSARFLREGAMLEHLPMLFWLADLGRPQVTVTLGLGDGLAHFALCQAVSRLVDRPLALGVAAEAVPEDLADWNAAHHDDISALVAGEAAALDRLGGRQIDLLCVEGDFDGALAARLTADWTARLSERGILVLHGTSGPILDRQGSRAALAGLLDGRRSLSLEEGRGLTIVLWGPDQAPALESLCANDASGAEILRLLARLGQVPRREWEARAAGHALEAARAAARPLAERVAVLEADLAEAEAARAALAAELAARAASWQAAEAALMPQIARRDRLLAERSAAADELEAETLRLRRMLEDRVRDCALLTRTILEREQGRHSTSEALQAALAAARPRIDDLRAAPGSAGRDPAALIAELDTLRDLAETQQQEMAALGSLAAGRKERLRALTREEARQRAETARLRGEIKTLRRERNRLLQSTSWKMTAPWRKLARLLRGGRARADSDGARP